MTEKLNRCPKCGDVSGDDWSQCGGVCPMPGSPHYAADALAPISDDVVERVARAIKDAIVMDMQSAREAARAALNAIGGKHD